MNKFSHSRDRRGDARPAQPPRPSTNISNDNNNNNNNNRNSGDDVRALDEKDAVSVDVLPANQRKNAKRIMPLPRTPGDDIVSWTSNGEVSIRGQRLRGTNIIDLIVDVLRSSRSSKKRFRLNTINASPHSRDGDQEQRDTQTVPRDQERCLRALS